MPPHWRPGSEACEFAYAEHPGWTPDQLERTIADFRDHWISIGERREDWDAAWRKWVRNQGNGKARSSATSLQDRNLTATAEWTPPATTPHGLADDLEQALERQQE